MINTSYCESLHLRQIYNMIPPSQCIRDTPSSPPVTRSEVTNYHHLCRASRDTTKTSSTTSLLADPIDVPSPSYRDTTYSERSSSTSSTMRLLDSRTTTSKTLFRRVSASLSRRLREHHQGVNAAFHLQYGSITTKGQPNGVN